MESIKSVLESIGQRHLLQYHDSLNDKELRNDLEKDLLDVDWKALDLIYKEQVSCHLEGSKLKPAVKIDENLLQELPGDIVAGTTRSTKEELNKYYQLGQSAIKEGTVAALLLAGGQGTRLGVDYPKGMFDIGLESRMSLFQLQAERIAQTSSEAHGPITWYIMTSEATTDRTKNFFQENSYFGLDRENVVFFEQYSIPCFDFNGKVLLSDKHRLSRSPNGNGGLYEALQNRKVLDHMQARGVRYIHVFCVDNVLVRVCDPIFMGYCIEKQADAAAKVVEKKIPTESVGTICKVEDKFKVIEYSEISDMIASKRDPQTGRLSFNAGNICEHFFAVDFLRTIQGDKSLRYHIAIKKIPYVSLETGEHVKPTEPNGIKLEKFIFDVFELTKRFVVWEVEREDEFSPLKNAEGSPRDNPTTARNSLLRAYQLGLLKI